MIIMLFTREYKRNDQYWLLREEENNNNKYNNNKQLLRSVLLGRGEKRSCQPKGINMKQHESCNTFSLLYMVADGNCFEDH